MPYNRQVTFVPDTAALAQDVNAEFNAVETATDLLDTQVADRFPISSLGSAGTRANKLTKFDASGNAALTTLTEQQFSDVQTNAAASATAAASSATAAASSATSASTSATSASTSATNASTSATSASTSATSASTSATNASTSATTATTQATNAATSATNAATSATAAATSATAAASSATAAASSATAAATSATNASTSATNASTSATNAANSATSAASLAAGVQGTSTTSLTIGTGSKTFTTQSGKQFAAGQWMTATSAADSNNQMFGQVTSYSGTTLIINVTVTSGSGTLADWNLSIAGIRGAPGPGGLATGTCIAHTGVVSADFIPLNGGSVLQSAYPLMSNHLPNFDPYSSTARTLPVALSSSTTTRADWIAYLGGTYVVTLLETGAVRTTTDLITYTSRSVAVNVRAVAAGAGVFVATDNANGSNIYSSADGTTWTARALGAAYSIQGLAFANSLFVASTANGNILTSADGITWTLRTSNLVNGTAYAVGYNGSLWLCLGNGEVTTSADGITWTRAAVTGNFGELAAGNGRFLRAQGTALQTSTNGVDWSTSFSLYDGTGLSIATISAVRFVGNLFFAFAGTTNATLCSVDGLNWGSLPHGADNVFGANKNRAAVANGVLFGCNATDTALLHTNTDGTRYWTPRYHVGGVGLYMKGVA